MTTIRLVGKIWDADRIIKKSFMFTGDLKTFIEKANAAGIRGTKLVLESDGTEVDDADVCQYFLEKNEIFQLISENLTWTTPASYSTSLKKETTVIEQPTAANDDSSAIINWINSSAPINEISTVQYVEVSNSPHSPLSTTISMSSGRISSLDSDKSDNIGIKNAQKLFANYQIPLKKMPEELVGLLNEQKHLGRYYTDFVHSIVIDMRRTSYYIPQTVFRKIAVQLLLAFPKSLGVVNSDGELVSDESVGLATKLLNHNNYINRTSKGIITSKTTKRGAKMSEGIPNFYKNENIEIYSDEESELKRIWLKEHFKMEIVNIELRQEILSVFERTFNAQRTFLLNNPQIKEVQQYWPHLLSPNFLISHFETLMNMEEKMFLERWENLKIKTLKFLEKKSKENDTYSADDDLKILEIITKHFKENLEIMIRQYPQGSTQNEIEALSTTPCFVITNSSDETVFYLIIEHQIVNFQYCSVKKAVFQLIAAFFVFNLEYPTCLSQTLEVLQRTYLNLNTDYSKSKKQKLNNKSKVVNFIKAIL